MLTHLTLFFHCWIMMLSILFHVLIGHLYIIFGKTSIWVLWHFLNWVILLSCWVSLYIQYINILSVMISKYFVVLQTVLSSCFVSVNTHKFLIFTNSNLSIFVFSHVLLVLQPRNHRQIKCPKASLLCFLLQTLGFRLKSLICY